MDVLWSGKNSRLTLQGICWRDRSSY